MCEREQRCRPPQERDQLRLDLEVERRRPPAGLAVERLVLGTVERELRRAGEQDDIALLPAAWNQTHVGDKPDAAHDGSRVDGPSLGLVVERDVAGDDRDSKRLAGDGDALDRLGQLPGDLGPLRIAKVETVGDGERLTARARDVPGGFEDCGGPARVWIEAANPAGAIERDREAAKRRPQPQHGGVEAWAAHGP